jgi:hypothetical protein
VAAARHDTPLSPSAFRSPRRLRRRRRPPSPFRVLRDPRFSTMQPPTQASTIACPTWPVPRMSTSLRVQSSHHRQGKQNSCAAVSGRGTARAVAVAPRDGAGAPRLPSSASVDSFSRQRNFAGHGSLLGVAPPAEDVWNWSGRRSALRATRSAFRATGTTKLRCNLLVASDSRHQLGSTSIPSLTRDVKTSISRLLARHTVVAAAYLKIPDVSAEKQEKSLQA